MSIIIRPANSTDIESMWEIFNQVKESGDTYIYDETTDKNFFVNQWLPAALPYVALQDNIIVGFYLLRQNKTGRGSHIANASYMVAPQYQNKGIGKLLGEDSLKKAKEAGYLAMQFNIVVSSNKRAVYLWQKLGFNIIGTVPKAFNHKNMGFVDAYIMHKFL